MLSFFGGNQVCTMSDLPLGASCMHPWRHQPSLHGCFAHILCLYLQITQKDRDEACSQLAASIAGLQCGGTAEEVEWTFLEQGMEDSMQGLHHSSHPDMQGRRGRSPSRSRAWAARGASPCKILESGEVQLAEG